MPDSDKPAAPPAAAPPPPAEAVPVKSLDDAQVALDEAKKKAEAVKGADAQHVLAQLGMFQGQLDKLKADHDAAGYIRTADLTEEQRQLLFSTRPENKPTFLGFLGRLLHDPWG